MEYGIVEIRTIVREAARKAPSRGKNCLESTQFGVESDGGDTWSIEELHCIILRDLYIMYVI